MLNLCSETEPRWVAAANHNLPDLLLDHTHCEKKAASTAINMLFRYPDHPHLNRPLSDLAREELEHFQLMCDVLAARGIQYRKLSPSLYAGRLLTAVRPAEPDRIVDTLLCMSLIEARSCERMKLLSEQLDDADLRRLYGDLLASEARHHHIYVDLATQIADREAVRARLKELAQHEAQVLVQAGDGLRMHSDA
jgi:tRNA-(ms[2]io[6]A)-hydroxylase